MSGKLVWLVAFVGAYSTYCIYWGVTTGRMASTANDYFLADRRLPPWVFVVAATAMSFSGWTFLGHPAMIFRDGFQFAETSLCAVVIPLTGVLFLKRQWLLGKRFGYVTPSEMYGDYFGGDGIRLLVLLVALVFAIPFVSMQLSASGYLIQVLSGGVIDRYVAMWVLTSVVFLYICFGGLRAAAYVGTLQGLLMAVGIIAIGLFAYDKLGGFNSFNMAMAKLGATRLGPWGASAEGYNAYLSIPGVVQFTAGLGKDEPVGGIWTASMILTYCFALMGIQAAPAFTMWGFSSRSPKGFAAQQVWASAAVMGLILAFFSLAQGMGAHFLGASRIETDAGLALSGGLRNLNGSMQADLVMSYLAAIAEQAPWFSALLAVCALAAIQAMAAAYATTTGTMLSRDLYRRYVNPEATDRQEKLFARIGIGLLIVAALIIATYAPSAQSELGALALAAGFQLFPALAAICWFPWITREGATAGLVGGLVTVVLTERFGASFVEFMGFHLPWGRWPWTIHSAGWGIVVNLVICTVVSWVSQRDEERQRRKKFHDFLQSYGSAGSDKRRLRPVAWAIAITWLFFAVGPGAVIGNDVFGAPNGGLAAWRLGVPSIWAWQVLWWALGVLMIWFLAYKMEMSAVVGRSLEFTSTGFVDSHGAAAVRPDWRRWFWGLVVAAGVIAGIHWMFG